MSAGSVGGCDEASAATGKPATRSLIDFRNITPAVLSSEADEVVCVALHGTTTVVGTLQGFVLVIDSRGLQARYVATPRQKITGVSLDAAGQFCAFSTADGSASIVSIAGGAPELKEQHGSAILSIALCPDYGSGIADSAQVCIGTQEGELILHRRSLLNKTKFVHWGEGPVTNICWRGTLIAWANSKGVKVYDVASAQKVSYVARPGRSELARCSIAWAPPPARTDNDKEKWSLLIGWGYTVKVAVILQNPDTAKGPGNFYAEVRHSFDLPGIVCGVAPISEHGQEAGKDQRMGGLAMSIVEGRSCQQLRLCSLSGEIFYTEEVPLQQGATSDSMSLSFYSSHLPMFVVAPRDLVLFTIRDFLEQAMWLLDHGYEQEAVRLANLGGELRHFICLKCVAPHLRTNSFEQACAAITQFKDLEDQTWQDCIVLFDKCGALQYLAVNVPVPPRGRRLPTNIYDEVLQRLVACPSALVTLLRLWPPEVFSAPALKEQLQLKLPAEDHSVTALDAGSRSLMEALALLEASSGSSETAVRHLLGLGSPDVFAVLRRDLSSSASTQKTPILAVAKSNIQRLFEIDDWEACLLLVDSRANFNTDTVILALQNCDKRWHHQYLKLLFEKDEVAGASYQNQMVKLFAEFEPKGLGGFLRKSERYDLEAALIVCQERGLLDEEAFLLGKTGRVSEALSILLEKMQDVDRAVHFASEYQDPSLWEALVSFVLEHPKLLVTLLDCLESLDTRVGVGGEASARPQPPPTAQPAHVLKRLPAGTPIPRVSASVRRVFDSFELQESLYQSCRRLAEDEMTGCKKAFLNSYRGGAAFKPDTWRCSACGRSLTEPPPDDPLAKDGDEVEAVEVSGSGIVFQGHSALHERCFQRQRQGSLISR